PLRLGGLPFYFGALTRREAAFWLLPVDLDSHADRPRIVEEAQVGAGVGVDAGGVDHVRQVVDVSVDREPTVWVSPARADIEAGVCVHDIRKAARIGLQRLVVRRRWVGPVRGLRD